MHAVVHTDFVGLILCEDCCISQSQQVSSTHVFVILYISNKQQVPDHARALSTPEHLHHLTDQEQACILRHSFSAQYQSCFLMQHAQLQGMLFKQAQMGRMPATQAAKCLQQVVTMTAQHAAAGSIERELYASEVVAGVTSCLVPRHP